MAKKNEVVKKWIPTDFILLNQMLGGGIPMGKIIEIFGFEGCGKTTLALELSKYFKSVYYIDYEHELDLDYVKRLGAKIKTFVQPITFEEGIDDFFKALKKKPGSYDLIITDTIGSSITQEELNADLADKKVVGMRAQKVTRYFQKAEKILKPLGITVISLNHKKNSFDSGWGVPQYNTPGGRQILYSASIRLSITQKQNKVFEDGIITNIWQYKNKVAQELENKNCQYMIRRGRGLSRGGETLELGLETGLIKKEGQSYKIKSKSFRGIKAIIIFLDDNDQIRNFINDKWIAANNDN